MRPFAATLILVLFPAGVVWANLPPNGGPERRSAQPANVEIRVDLNTEHARLFIPRKFLDQRRADAANEGEDKAVVDAGRSPLHLAIAGLALRTDSG
jgi:hypothetical protein